MEEPKIFGVLFVEPGNILSVRQCRAWFVKGNNSFKIRIHILLKIVPIQKYAVLLLGLEASTEVSLLRTTQSDLQHLVNMTTSSHQR